MAASEEKREMKEFQAQTTHPGGVENKVVECSILQGPPKTEQKETQASTASESHKKESASASPPQ